MRASVLGAALIAAALAPGAAQAAQGPPTARSPERHDLPLTTPASAVAPRTLAARSRLRAGLGRAAVVAADPRTGALRAVGRTDGFLTGPSRRRPATVALGFVRAHLAAFGLEERDLATLRLVRSYRSRDGVTHLLWRQSVDGIPVVDADLRANVTRQGRLVNVLGGPRGRLRLSHGPVATTARAAYATVLRSVGSSARAPRVRAQTGRARQTDFAGRGVAQLVAYASGARTRLAWRVVVPASRTGDYDALVDVRSGRLLSRSNLVEFANALVHESYPGAPLGGEQILQPIGRWLTPGAGRLIGNNAHAFLDPDDVVGTTITPDRVVDRYDVPPAGEVGPSDGANWLYPLTSVPDPAGRCPEIAPGCTWNHKVPFSWRTNAAQATTQLFYFVNRFHDHLADDPIGFDEASGNFQAVNRSGAGRGGDAVLAQADDGANTTGKGLPDQGHIDNANMDTRPDGTPPRMQMYLWQPFRDKPGAPDFAAVNGSDDPEIVYHEYTHGLSNRLITDSMGFGALDNQQASAMGEAWSDWYALDFLAQQGLFTDAPGAGDVKEGDYVDRGGNLIRTEPLDCSVGAPASVCPGSGSAGPGGYTYGDFGRVLGIDLLGDIPEPHADGEIWAQTLWQLRQALVGRYGQSEGSRRAERLVTGGMRLSPPEPTYLDMRNAILQQDLVDGRGDAATIWSVFADRGMGWSASTTGPGDVTPVEDFSLPPAAGTPTGTIRGTVTDDRGRPLAGVRVGLGGHDTPGTADPLQATTGADGTYAIADVPQGTYPAIVAHAPTGYAEVRDAALTVTAGTVRRDFTLRRNYADLDAAAHLRAFTGRDESAFGCGPRRGFDGDVGTGLDTTGPVQDDPSTPADETRTVVFTVELPVSVTGTEVWIDPTAHCYNLFLSSLGAYRLELSPDGRRWSTVAESSFSRSSLYRLNRVGLRNAPPRVRWVRLTALSTMVPGNPFLSFSELQVYGRRQAATARG
jgi:hypothetical protein